MKKTRIIMGMPITIEIVDTVESSVFKEVFDYFKIVDHTFSTYKKESEISRINRGELVVSDANTDVQKVLKLCEETKEETNGYFDVWHNGHLDPSGLVKGWAILNASQILDKRGCKNYFIDAGSDIQAMGKSLSGKKWRIGIKNPFNEKEIVKVLGITNKGVATSGTYIRGEHIYNPVKSSKQEIISLTVIGPNIYEADRFATAAFAMGKEGIAFIEGKKELEGYMIERNGIAKMTSGFGQYIV